MRSCRTSHGPGECATVPARALHGLANESPGPVTFRAELCPGSRGFEKALQVARANGVERRLEETYCRL